MNLLVELDEVESLALNITLLLNRIRENGREETIFELIGWNAYVELASLFKPHIHNEAMLNFEAVYLNHCYSELWTKTYFLAV